MAASGALSATSNTAPLPSAALLSSLKSTARNVTTAYLGISSTKDIILAPLRGIAKLDNLLVRRIPNYILGQAQHFRPGRWTEEAGRILGRGGRSLIYPGAVHGEGAMAEAVAQAAAGQVAAQATETGWTTLFAEAFQASSFKSYFGMLHYLTSRWAFTCFTMALILNRVQVYASSRQRISLSWEKRLTLRLIPILLLLSQIYSLLQAIRCQTSPEYCLYRHGSMNKYSLLDWAPEGGFLHTLSSTILYTSSDEAACASAGMSRPAPDVRARFGSFSLLWPSYVRLCLSHLVETISCHLQQTTVLTEVGMSIFEHSLAFAEAETMISHSLGLDAFGSPKATSAQNSTSAGPTIAASGTILAISDATISLTGLHILNRVNVPTEVLLVALLSCCNALSSNIISVCNKQRSLRLINTGFWGLCFIAAFVWGFCSTSTMVRLTDDGESEEMRTVSGLLHFPTVAIIGFLPHMTILVGMGVCLMIYAVALTLTALSLNSNPDIPQPSSFSNRFRIAHDNLQAAIQVRGINIKWHEDFYTALLRIGFTALTAASEAVFLNEGRSVEMRQFTWLEEERLDEIEASRAKLGSENSHFQIAEEYGLPPSSPGAPDRGGKWESGYAKERTLEKEKESDKDKSGSAIYPNPRSGGVGALQRTARFYLLFVYIRGIVYLSCGYLAFGVGLLFDRIGITARPKWLRSLIGRSLKRVQHERAKMILKDETGKAKEFWILTEDGSAAAPGSLDTDIEPEMRRRLALEHPDDSLDEVVDQQMYEWWKGNGWYGTKDGSGDYQPSHQDDFEDTTSIISMSTNASEAEYATPDERAWESESEGRRTPTQRSSAAPFNFFRSSRSPTPASQVNDTPLDLSNLVRLLNPQDKASREEARMLASHLAASASENRIMTRSRYRHELETERSRVLLAGRRSLGAKSSGGPAIPLYSLPESASTNQARPLTPAEEVEVLESLILSRRQPRQGGLAGQVAPSDDNEPVGSGPTMPCVVCQAAPRTIIAWPCRCLCVCEDCRVNLALNNFGNCVTCRRSVGGFVRLWVP